jgi:hypothetical protein
MHAMVLEACGSYRAGVSRWASTTLTAPAMGGHDRLSCDIAAAIGELKAKPGGGLQVHGSGA